MPTCPACKGGKVQHLTVVESGKPDKKQDIPCVWCYGTGEVSPEVMEEWKTESTMWCQCGNPSTKTDFYADGQHTSCPYGIHKHHYHCSDCGDIKQIG